MTKTFTDTEFGEVTIHFRSIASAIRVSVGTDGRLRASAPKFTPVAAVKLMVNTHRGKIRDLFKKSIAPTLYAHGQQVGKSHHIVVVPVAATLKTSARTQGLNIIVRLPAGESVTSPGVQRIIRDCIIDALRREAKAHLPRRLAQLAAQHNYHYERVRFSHAGTRWGSCSSTGTISLNIALMKLPDELIDYVLAHELAHTVHMNHSTAFWAEVRTLDPHYTLHRRQLRQQTPTI